MSTVKTKIEKNIVFSYIKNNFDNSVSNLNFISGGEMSQAFSFQTDIGIKNIDEDIKSELN